MYLLGQVCGIIGTIITIIQPQFRSKVQILICAMLINGFNSLNFLWIGHGGSAVALCWIAIVQSAIAIWHEKQGTHANTLESVIFFFLYVGAGLFGMVTAEGFLWEISWANALELLPIIGALMLMFSVFAKGEQRTRFFLLLNGAAWVLYTAIIGATTFFSCVASMISSIIALWRNRENEE